MQVNNKRWAMCAALSALWLTACDAPKAPEVQTPAPAASAPTPLTPAQRVEQAMAEDARLNAQVLVERAKLASFRRAMSALKVELDVRDSERPKPTLDTLGAPSVTLLFSGNNHGELEDCGCVSRPLGGLARRATLFEAVKSNKGVQKLWGQAAPKKASATFVVDSGESLTRAVSAPIDQPNVRARAKRNALAVIEGMNQSPPDAMGVGEREVLLGKDALLEFQTKSAFPMISANLQDAKTQALVLPASVKVERAGQTLWIVGLTNPRSRFGDFYSARGLKVLDPYDAYVKAVADAPAGATVVLLSNLGVSGTTQLLRRLKEGGHRADAVVVSGSNSLTKEPRWAAGIPMVEPLSRGKYVGRLDLYVVDSKAGWSFANAGESVDEAMLDYSRAMQAYMGTRVAQLQDEQEMVYMKLLALKRMAAASEPLKPLRSYYSERNDKKSTMLEGRQSTVTARRELHSSALGKALSQLNAAEASTQKHAAQGLDVAQVLALPVDLKIPEAKSVVKVLKPYEDLKTPLPEEAQ